ncbi:MAG: c-type cytochrome [Variovorax sp.]|nr:c-type cytochrome [Variovorax sp.]
MAVSVLAGSVASRALDAAAAQGVLDPAGVQAVRIHDLWLITLWTCMAVFAAILVALMAAMVHARRRARRAPAAAPRPIRAQRTRGVVVFASVLSATLLAALVVLDVSTDRALSRLPVADALHIEMIGSQWWWQARYRQDDGGPDFAVANDLHVPVGRPVVVTLKSVDVIHTFWVPQLHGKKDMLPGRSATLQFRADRAGTFRGECAEFCGLQHALMAFSVTAESPERFADWQAHQARPAEPPPPGDAQRGQALFLSRSCAQCHTVRGTPATGTLGPDLTHVASRATLAAGTFANEPGLLAAWIVQPQSLKAGSTMPPSELPPEDVRLLVAYLGTLR